MRNCGFSVTNPSGYQTGIEMILWPRPLAGGHTPGALAFVGGATWVEVWFLNRLRPRISAARGAQVAARVAVWFVGGIGLAVGMGLTAMASAGFRPAHWPAWWLAGLAFIGIELAAHLVLQLRGHPSIYHGRG
jgi:hypothetical protein